MKKKKLENKMLIYIQELMIKINKLQNQAMKIII